MMLEWQTIIENNMLGSFYILTEELIQCPDIIAKLLSNMIIVEAKASYSRRSIDYEAYGPMFFPLPEGKKPDSYYRQMSVDESGRIIGMELVEPMMMYRE